MKDRLAEFHQLSDSSSTSDSISISSTTWYDTPVDSRVKTVDRQPLYKKLEKRPKMFKKKGASKLYNNMDKNVFLNTLNATVQSIKSEVSRITSNTKEITALHTKALMVPSLEKNEKMRIEELEHDTKLANSRAIKHLKELKKIEVPNTAASQRIHDVQVSQAHNSLLDAVEKYQKELQRFARALRQQVVKQTVIVNGGRCDSGVIDARIEDGRLQMFVDDYLTMEQEARAMLQDVEDRHKELLKLEQSIEEVQVLFGEVAMLVMAQGDIIDNIAAHVEAANTEVTKGSKNLSSAKKKQKSSRKKKIVLGSVGAAVATGLILTFALL